MFGLSFKSKSVDSDNFLFRHDLLAIKREFSFLNEHYASDYPQIAIMHEISCSIAKMNDLCAIKKACDTLYRRIALIQRYDVEFKVSSLDLLVRLDNVQYCTTIEQ